MRPEPLLALLGLGLLGASLATGQSMTSYESEEALTASVAHDGLEFQLQEDKAGPEASDLRREIDDQGDGDGTVTREEVVAYQDRGSQVFGATYAACFENFRFLRIGGHAPSAFREIRLTLVGAEGVAGSPAAILFITSFHFAYPGTEGDPTVVIEYARLHDTYTALTCGAAFGGTHAPDYDGGTYRGTETFVVAPADGYSIDASTLKPGSAANLWDGRTLTANTEPEREYLRSTPIEFKLRGGPATNGPWHGWVQTAAVVGAIGTGGAALGAAALVSTEIGRYKLLKALAAVPLFTRFEKDDVLEHNTREQLYQFIRNNPGPSFSDLRRELELSNGTLVHHLRILEMQEFVKPLRDGFRTRFYIRGPRIVPTTYLTRTQSIILEAIQGNPGVTQKQLAQILGLPRESVFYHTRKLESAGKLRIAKEGKWRRYFPAPEPSPGGPGAAAP